ncbi:MAG: histidine triad nucleotide-binding protein [Oceanospirillaceae bacterium]|nr:histidine triad nucleotide-binding protein [Oceanospirillaceae bacterium]MBT11585.1 histidine triad nucleotide-binding protein [Oceanospirillaceae bacterium]|tara:strand:- start:32220 stop:32552 length:333 start_codon:yes stop_codon:yes gene_type:complete
MSDCVFCKIVAGELPASVVYEDDQLLAFASIEPKADTHLLVIPKRHIENLDALTAGDAELISHLMLTLPGIAEKAGLSGYRTITNTGVAGGQEVFHMHFHILGGNELPGF